MQQAFKMLQKNSLTAGEFREKIVGDLLFEHFADLVICQSDDDGMTIGGIVRSDGGEEAINEIGHLFCAKYLSIDNGSCIGQREGYGLADFILYVNNLPCFTIILFFPTLRFLSIQHQLI